MRVIGVLLLAAALAIAGCTPLLLGTVNLDGTRWVAVRVGGLEPEPGFEPTIGFEGGRVSGTGGCNGYASDEGVAIEGDRLRMPSVLMTLGNCVDPQQQGDAPMMRIERVFYDALRVADHIELRGSQLVISGGNGELVFEPIPRDE